MLPHSKPWITDDDLAAMREVMQSGMIASGGLVDRFQARMADRLGMSAGVAAASGKAALEHALRLVGVGAGDGVVLPTYVCESVAEAVKALGAEPQLCDVDTTGCPSAETVEQAIRPNTTAIIAVHIFGHVCDIGSLRRFGLPVIEDACQALGFAAPEGGLTGGLADVSVLSFHATKCLATGEGGMVMIRNGADVRDDVPAPAPLSDLQAALGLSQLARYDDALSRRKRMKSDLDAVLRTSGCTVPQAPDQAEVFRYVFASGQPFDALQSRFAEDGIALRRGVDALLHREAGQADTAFPQAVALYDTLASVPFYPALSDAEFSRVSEVMESIA
jgi:UDP-4-amino-4-deoxy-L-arabinose-oxoglutarate aminotransferase